MKKQQQIDLLNLFQNLKELEMLHRLISNEVPTAFLD